MVGLSIVLEVQKGINEKTTQTRVVKVINKVTMMKPSPSSSPPHPHPHPLPPFPPSCQWNSPSSARPATSFLEQCFLCKQKLLPGKDIYMYKGDRAFCSVECRCRQIFMDEEETAKRGNCMP
uniref:FLZ-type domain-containing protein n=1 Tax=Davidia involucrata TaxID=16924 RepID=A0A5B6YNK1_DAVIN